MIHYYARCCSLFFFFYQPFTQNLLGLHIVDTLSDWSVMITWGCSMADIIRWSGDGDGLMAMPSLWSLAAFRPSGEASITQR